jgi:hypothetical protein
MSLKKEYLCIPDRGFLSGYALQSTPVRDKTPRVNKYQV